MKKLSLICAAAILSGCAHYKTVQQDISYDIKGAPTRQIETTVTATTLFDSSSSLAKFRANQTDKSQGTSVGSLEQGASSTNAAAMWHDAVELFKALPK